ncbi:MAG: hypothetical protein ACK5NT_12895 [Pyrinomonadaceae bacterium]
MAQDSAETKATPNADPNDVATVDSILSATYSSISGAVGEERNWDRFRSLFYPGARLIPAAKNREGKFVALMIDPDGYISRSGKFLVENGFTEKEISRTVERYGNIAQVFSTYEGSFIQGGKPQKIRGINSFQLMFDGTRWWVITIFWQQESKEFPLPKEYLKRIKEYKTTKVE